MTEEDAPIKLSNEPIKNLNALLICSHPFGRQLKSKIAKALNTKGNQKNAIVWKQRLSDVYSKNDFIWLPEHKRYDIVISHESDLGNFKNTIFGAGRSPKLVTFSTVGFLNCTKYIKNGIGQIEKRIDENNCTTVFSEIEWHEIFWSVLSGTDKMPECTRNKNTKSLLDMFWALHNILQGYLAVWEPIAIFGENANSFMREHKILEGELKKKAEEKTNFKIDLTDEKQRLFRPRNLYPLTLDKTTEFYHKPAPLEPGWYWFDDCLPDVKKKSWDELKKEIPELGGKKRLAEIWNILRTICLQMNENHPNATNSLYGYDQSSLTKLIADAHKECITIVGREQKKNSEDFDRYRMNLNHNLVKNEFLHGLGRSQASDVKVRSEKIEIVWSIIRKEKTNNPDLTDIEASVDQAIKIWPQIKAELKELFSTKLEECGMTLTEQGKALKNELIGQKNFVETTISGFIYNFERIGNLPENDRTKWLNRFWGAADQLHEALSKMAKKNEDKGSFGGFIATVNISEK